MGTKTQGCKLFWSTDSGTTYTEVEQVTNVTVPTGTKDRLETTHLTSTSKTYIAGLSDTSSAAYSMHFDGSNSSHQSMVALDASGDEVKWKVELVNPTGALVDTGVYDGYVESLEVSADTNGIQAGTLTVQPSAAATWAHGATAET